MFYDAIEYESETHDIRKVQITGVDTVPTLLDKSTKNGLTCAWYGEIVIDDRYQVRFTWEFEYDESNNDNNTNLVGTIFAKVCREQEQSFKTVQTTINSAQTCDSITMMVEKPSRRDCAYAKFQYNITPWPIPLQFSNDEIFLPSYKNDAVLIIGEHRLYVNKTFLSYHSDYFRALFSSNFKDGTLDEIELKDVVYADFGLLMNTIYPKTVFPSDRTVEKILAMADRFMVQSAIDHVEYHLLHNSRIANENLVWMADKYGMNRLLKKSILKMDSIEKAKKLRDSPLFTSLSHDAKVMVLEKLMNLL